MADSVDILKKLAQQVRNATQEGENTAERVGRVLVGILDNLGSADLEGLFEIFLRKDQPDSTEFLVKFIKGIELGKFVSGLLGTGGAIQIDQDGNSHAEFDYLTIRKLAIFIELIIQEAKHVGGMLIVSPSGMTISKVEETDTAYRCYFEQTDGDRTINNQFTVGTQARRQTFNLTNQAYYWRLVTAVGADYIDLSKTDCDTGSTIPQVGDELVGLGHRTDKTRQAAIIISAFGTDSPSIKYYQGIDSYSLEEKAVKMDYYDPVSGRYKSVTYGDTYVGDKEGKNYIKFDQEEGVEVSGKVKIQQGSEGAGNFSDLPDEIYNAVKIGGENLLLNTGFLGDFDALKLDSNTTLKEATEMYNTTLDKWNGTATLNEDSNATSGVSATIGSLSQNVSLIQNENYVISYKAKGTSFKIVVGGSTISQELTGEYHKYSHVFTNNGGMSLSLSGDATFCDMKLERGTIPTDWCPSVLDPSSVKDNFKSLWYLQDALKGETQFIGGLTLTSMIQLGKFVNGVMEKVNAGISGIYNDDTDVAFWAGGTFEQAIATVQKILGGETPTDDEWKSLAKFVATHGGDVFIRGYIYALGGVFNGTIYAKGGEFAGYIKTNLKELIESDAEYDTYNIYDESGSKQDISGYRLKDDLNIDASFNCIIILPNDSKYAGSHVYISNSIVPPYSRNSLTYVTHIYSGSYAFGLQGGYTEPNEETESEYYRTLIGGILTFVGVPIIGQDGNTYTQWVCLSPQKEKRKENLLLESGSSSLFLSPSEISFTNANGTQRGYSGNITIPASGEESSDTIIQVKNGIIIGTN